MFRNPVMVIGFPIPFKTKDRVEDLVRFSSLEWGRVTLVAQLEAV